MIRTVEEHTRLQNRRAFKEVAKELARKRGILLGPANHDRFTEAQRRGVTADDASLACRAGLDPLDWLAFEPGGTVEEQLTVLRAAEEASEALRLASRTN